jgi:hypothetical protein
MVILFLFRGTLLDIVEPTCNCSDICSESSVDRSFLSFRRGNSTANCFRIHTTGTTTIGYVVYN